MKRRRKRRLTRVNGSASILHTRCATYLFGAYRRDESGSWFACSDDRSFLFSIRFKTRASDEIRSGLLCAKPVPEDVVSPNRPLHLRSTGGGLPCLRCESSSIDMSQMVRAGEFLPTERMPPASR